jgi:hypothetical protein
LNTNYDDTKTDAAMLSAVISARQSGDLPRKSVYLAVKQAGYLPEDMTYEAFVEEVLHDRDMVDATDADYRVEMEEEEDGEVTDGGGDSEPENGEDSLDDEEKKVKAGKDKNGGIIDVPVK